MSGYLLASAVLAAAAALPYNFNIETNEVIENPRPSLNAVPDLIVDFALAELRHFFNDRNETSIPIPDLSSSFTEDILGLKVRGEFSARRGSFANPATIIRKGPARVDFTPQGVVFTVVVGFSQMDVLFKQYQVTFADLSETGSVELAIKENSMEMEVAVNYTPRCEVKLRRMEFVKLDGVEADVTGLGVLNPIADEIVQWVLEKYNSSFTSMIEDLVQKKIDQELSHTSFCKKQYYYS